MKKRNVWKNVEAPLEKHHDYRGVISDIFYNSKIDHVAIISSEPDIIRGNHYHKETTQHILITKGSLEYWYKNVDKTEPSKKIIANIGDLVTTPPLEIHALKIGPAGNEFIVFSEGTRGGKDYESDTYRVENIIES